jgi:uncharacterized Ntn-hydrolase superfamily protein
MLIAALSLAAFVAPAFADPSPVPRRPVSTYSIVARDPATGEIGVAVQSHAFSVGSIVTWAEPGVGAVATQSLVDPANGPLGLGQMRLGRSAPDALRSLLAGDANREVRQVAMIDAEGRVAAHTGDRCIAYAGMVVDADGQFSVQANLMANDKVWPAMAAAFRRTKGDLAERMLAALEAAEAAGGDVRGRQSAAILVVNRDATGKPWIDRRFDLRVEDHPEPVKELRRLVQLKRAYLLTDEGDLAMERNDPATAQSKYAAAEDLVSHPQVVEVRFWRAVTLASSGRLDEALPIFRRVFAEQPFWVDLVPRVAASGLMPDDKAAIAKIVAQAPPKK